MMKFIFALLIALNVQASSFFKGPALIEGVTTTTTAAGTTTLTASSETNEVFTGSTTQTVTLPNATTLPVGRRFYIGNRSTGTVTVNFNGGALARTLIADTQGEFILRDNSTSAGLWSIDNMKIDLAASGSITGLLPLTNGGTNKNNTASAGAIAYSDASGILLNTVGTSGYVLTSGGTGAPTFIQSIPIANGGTGATAKAGAFDALSPMTTGGDLIYGGASGTGTRLANGNTGNILRSAGGTNAPTWTTTTWPTTTTANQILYSSSANAIGQITTAATSALVTSSGSVPSLTSGTVANRLLRTDGTTISFAQAGLTTDVTGILPIANGGTGLSSLAWSSFTPTISAASGTITTSSASGQYLQINKTVCFSMGITITTNGTGAGNLQATLPTSSLIASVFPAVETQVTGTGLYAYVIASSNTLVIKTYNNLYPAGNGYIIIVSGCYQST